VCYCNKVENERHLFCVHVFELPFSKKLLKRCLCIYVRFQINSNKMDHPKTYMIDVTIRVLAPMVTTKFGFSDSKHDDTESRYFKKCMS